MDAPDRTAEVVPLRTELAAQERAVIELEQQLIGAVLMRPEALDYVGQMVAEDFAAEAHRVAWAEIDALHAGGRVPTPHLVAPAMAGCKLGDVAPVAYLIRCAGTATSMVNVADMARTIRDAADRRRMVAAGQSLIDRARLATFSEPLATIASGTIEVLDGVVSRRTSKFARRVTIAEAARSAILEIEDRRRSGRELAGATWGLKDLDRATMGMIPGNVVVLAGRPGMGKSAIAVSAALAAARAGHGVLFVSKEMKAEELALRALSDLAWSNERPVPYSQATRPDISDYDFEKLLRAEQKLAGLPLEIEPQPGLTMSQIAARARRVAREMEAKGRRLEVLIIDHLGIVKSSTRYAGNKVAETSEVSNALKPLAKDLDCAVVALSQLNRQVEARDDKRPTLADLRWAGEIEQDADVVIGAYRHAYYYEQRKNLTPDEQATLDTCRNELELIILKQRMGPTKTVTAFCDIGSNVVRDHWGR
jgi:replicative DNA helicase